MKLNQFLNRVNAILDKIITNPFRGKEMITANPYWFRTNAEDEDGNLIGKLGHLFTRCDLYAPGYIAVVAFVIREAGIKVFGDHKRAYVVRTYEDYDEVSNPNSIYCASIGWDYCYEDSGMKNWCIETDYCQHQCWMKDGKLFIRPRDEGKAFEIPPFSMTLEEVIKYGRKQNTSPGPAF